MGRGDRAMSWAGRARSARPAIVRRDRSNTGSSAAEVDHLLERREALGEVHAVGVLDALAEPTIVTPWCSA
jgi:hypothetical protein